MDYVYSNYFSYSSIFRIVPWYIVLIYFERLDLIDILPLTQGIIINQYIIYNTFHKVFIIKRNTLKVVQTVLSWVRRKSKNISQQDKEALALSKDLIKMNGNK